MLSMYDNPEYVNRAMQAGARGYVLKDAPSSRDHQRDRGDRGGPDLPQPGALRAGCRARRRRGRCCRMRESEILALPRQGLREQADRLELGLSVRTVETHRQNIKRKLNLAGQAELIKYAVERCREFDGP